MKIAVHITFFFVETRLDYLRKVIANFEELPHDLHFFIYSNRDLKSLIKASNVQFKLFPYKKFGVLGYNGGFWNKLKLTSFVHPYHLAWENRKVVEQIVDAYDVQMYIEDDIAFKNENFNYWLKYKDICNRDNYNLGFLRFESDSKNQTYLTDLFDLPKKTIRLNQQLFLINNTNPYCGFWIYGQDELKKFVKTNEWNFKFKGIGIREKSAIGWHGLMMNRYQGTILPLCLSENGEYILSQGCAVHHIPNTYINDPVHCKIKLPKLTEII